MTNETMNEMTNETLSWETVLEEPINKLLDISNFMLGMSFARELKKYVNEETDDVSMSITNFKDDEENHIKFKYIDVKEHAENLKNEFFNEYDTLRDWYFKKYKPPNIDVEFECLLMFFLEDDPLYSRLPSYTTNKTAVIIDLLKQLFKFDLPKFDPLLHSGDIAWIYYKIHTKRHSIFYHRYIREAYLQLLKLIGKTYLGEWKKEFKKRRGLEA